MPTEEIVLAIHRGYIDDVANSAIIAQRAWEKRGWSVERVEDRGRAADEDPERYSPWARRVRVFFKK